MSIIDTEIVLSKTQSKTWKKLFDNTTNEIVYGGGVSGGKSFLGCLWLATCCIKYPGTRYLLGRSQLQVLKMTSLKTLFEVLKMMGLNNVDHYNYNQQLSVIKFTNGSEILLKNLEYSPSDPNYETLQGYELTGALLEEASQLTETCYNIVKSRIRFKLTEFGLVPKIMMTCNPGNNYIKKLFYIPSIDGTISNEKAFIQSLISDNPYASQDYINFLNTLPSDQKSRLLYGDWDYSEDINTLFKYDDIINSIYRFEPDLSKEKYMSIDVARMGSDQSIISIWVGLCLIDIKVYEKLKTTQLSAEIESLIKSHNIKRTNVIIDETGVGSGVVDQVNGKGFISNASPLSGENYFNLKSQCYGTLSRLFQEGKISINIMDRSIVEELTQELLSIKLKNGDNDKKIQVTSKDEVKRILGRSPDIADSIMMVMFYHIFISNKPTGKYQLAFI